MSKKSKTSTKDNNQNSKKQLLVGIILIIIMFVVVTGISYAAFQYFKPSEKSNQIKTGTLILVLDDTDENGISITNAIPTSDDIGKGQDPYQFKLTNTGTIDSNYRIKIVADEAKIAADGCSNNLLSTDKVRYLLTKNNVDSDVAYLDSKTDSIFDSGTLKAGETNTYSFRMWLDSSITNPSDINGKHLHVKVVSEAISTKGQGF